ncbi:hypothetical protein D9M71_240440 [compost metagenome]
MNRLDHVVAVVAWHLELEAALQGIEKGCRRTFVDAHGPVALHVAVTPHRAQAGTRAANVAAQQHQVGDLLDGRHRMAMLGDTHGPAHDDVLALGVHARRLLDLDQGQAGLLDDLLPRGVVDDCQVLQHIGAVLIEEVMVEHRGCAGFLCVALPQQDKFRHAAHDRHVTAQGRAEERGVGRFVAVGEHFDRVLRVLETFQAAFLERVDAHHLRTAFHRFTQRFEHAWVVGAGVLAPDENRIGVFEVVEGHGAFADADTLRQRHTAGLVAHVRAVREIVGAVGAHEQLVQISRFVAGTARGVELGLVRARQAVQVFGDQCKSVVPTDRFIAVRFGVVAHRLGQATLVFEPVVALLQQRSDAVSGEEFGVDTALGRFPVHRLGAVLAEHHHALFRRIAPGATRAVEATVLVGLEHDAQVFQCVVAGQPGLGHTDQSTPATGRTFVGLVARDGGLVGLTVLTHA